MAYGAFFVLKTVCLMCLVTYVAVIGIFLVSSAATRFPMSTLPSRAIRDLKTLASSPVALTVLVLFLVAAGSAIAFFPREGGAGQAPVATPASTLTPEQRTQIEQQFDQMPRAIVPVDPGGAAVLIVKFHDFQCPPCRRTFEEYKPILARYAQQAPGKVKYVEKQFPLDPECNPNTPNGGHLAACEAAAAALLARDKGEAVGAKMEDWLYSNQPMLTPESIRQAAREVAGLTDFDARYQAALQQVKADAALGGLLQVKSTPTFFINGVKIDGGLAPPVFDAIIAHELKKAAK
jgi:protein-disulfide isomerase